MQKGQFHCLLQELILTTDLQKQIPNFVRLELRYCSTMARSYMRQPFRTRLKEANRLHIPKRVKYRKVHRGRMTGKSQRGSEVAFGEYGLQALEPGWIKNTQIEAARIAMTRYIRRGGKVWIRIFPDKPVTEKPAET